MISSIKVRIAKESHTCNKCGHIIEKGSDYIDYVEKTGDGFIHKRWHDNCPKATDNLVIKLAKLLVDSSGQILCADDKGNKAVIIGIIYANPLSLEPAAIVKGWGENADIKYEPMKTIETCYHYADGSKIFNREILYK